VITAEITKIWFLPLSFFSVGGHSSLKGREGRAGNRMKSKFYLLSNFLVQYLHGCGIVLSAGDKNDGKTENG
jgi:hypothetical protein